MSNNYKIEYPASYNQQNHNGLTYDYSEFAVILDKKVQGYFPFHFAFAPLNLEKVIDFEGVKLIKSIVLHNEIVNFSLQEEAKKITSLLEEILAFCAEKSNEPLFFLDNFFPPYSDYQYYSLELWEEISQYQISASWDFINSVLDPSDSTLFSGNDVFEERIKIQLSWVNEQGLLVQATGYWTISSVKRLMGRSVLAGFHYRQFLLVSHFFYKPFIDEILEEIVDGLNKIAPINREKVIWHYFSIAPIECIWSAV